MSKAGNARLRIFDFILKAMGSHSMGEKDLRSRRTEVVGGGLEEARQAASNLGKILEYGLSSTSWALKDV